jgi:hypothetical protein
VEDAHMSVGSMMERNRLGQSLGVPASWPSAEPRPWQSQLTRRVISSWIIHTVWRTGISCRGAPTIVLRQEADGKPLGPNSRVLFLRRKGRACCKSANIRQMLLKFILGPAFHLFLHRKGMCAMSTPSLYNYYRCRRLGIALKC